MPVYFFDSSVVYKRYIHEPGSTWVRSIVERNPPATVFISKLAQVEVVAAIRRTGRINGWDIAYVNTAVNMFQRHLALSAPDCRVRPYRVIPLEDEVLELATSLCDTHWNLRPHPLRSLDAIQLACALIVYRELPDALRNDFLSATADMRLSAMAPVVGLNSYNPAHP